MSGLAKIVAPIVKIVAPIAGAALGGPAGALVGGAIGGVAGGGNRHDILRNTLLGAAVGLGSHYAAGFGLSGAGTASGAFNRLKFMGNSLLASPLARTAALGLGGMALIGGMKKGQGASPPMPMKSMADLDAESRQAAQEALKYVPLPRANNAFGAFKNYSPTAYRREINTNNRRLFPNIKALKHNDQLREKLEKELKKALKKGVA